MDRRDFLKNTGFAAASVIPAAQAAQTPAGCATDEKNPYGSPPGSGITIPPYYRPTPSVKNRNTYFPESEALGPDEMRITFMGSNPWPPRLTQAGTCIMVELGNGRRFFFDMGSGALRNIIGNQVPIPEINDIFISHLHVDHYADLPYLHAFSAFAGRWKPLRVYGPSGRTKELGTRAMIEHMLKMSAWHIRSFESLPVGDGYEADVTEFDYRDDGGVCYDKGGVKVMHWRRSHTMDGASAYRLDWNGLSFVWTGDGKPDELTAKYAHGADVFVTELAVNNPALWSLKQGAPIEVGAFTIDSAHTPHYGVGYLTHLVNPRLGMATHVSYDRELLEEMLSGVRMCWRGMFALGIDHTVVNVTKDAVWIREAAIPESANAARPDSQWMLREMFGGQLPKELPKPKYLVSDNQEQSIRDLEIKPEVFTPRDQWRKWVREWPKDVSPAQMFGGGLPPAKK